MAGDLDTPVFNFQKGVERLKLLKSQASSSSKQEGPNRGLAKEVAVEMEKEKKDIAHQAWLFLNNPLNQRQVPRLPLLPRQVLAVRALYDLTVKATINVAKQAAVDNVVLKAAWEAAIDALDPDVFALYNASQVTPPQEVPSPLREVSPPLGRLRFARDSDGRPLRPRECLRTDIDEYEAQIYDAISALGSEGDLCEIDLRDVDLDEVDLSDIM